MSTLAWWLVRAQFQARRTATALSMLAETLSQAASYVHIARRHVHVDSLNRVFEEPSPDTHPISFVEVKVDRKPPLERVLVALRIHRSALQPVELKLEDAARLLG